MEVVDEAGVMAVSLPEYQKPFACLSTKTALVLNTNKTYQNQYQTVPTSAVPKLSLCFDITDLHSLRPEEAHSP